MRALVVLLGAASLFGTDGARIAKDKVAKSIISQDQTIETSDENVGDGRRRSADDGRRRRESDGRRRSEGKSCLVPLVDNAGPKGICKGAKPKGGKGEGPEQMLIRDGKKCKVSCAAGFMSDFDKVKCKDGEFRDEDGMVAELKCEEGCSARMPSAKEGKDHKVCKGKAEMYKFGEECDIECPKGYEGEGIMTCNETDGGWDNPEPCSPKSCEVPKKDKFANGCLGGEADLQHGSACEVICQEPDKYVPKYENYMCRFGKWEKVKHLKPEEDDFDFKDDGENDDKDDGSEPSAEKDSDLEDIADEDNSRDNTGGWLSYGRGEDYKSYLELSAAGDGRRRSWCRPKDCHASTVSVPNLRPEAEGGLCMSRRRFSGKLKHGKSCKPACNEGFSPSSDAWLTCKFGTVTIGEQFSCVKNEEQEE